MRRTTVFAVGIAVTALIATGCSSGNNSANPSSTPPPSGSSTASTSAEPTTAVADSGGAFSAAGPDFTYNEAAVPIGSTLTAEVDEADGMTTVDIQVTGLQPDRAYGAHAHTLACGPTPSDSGPHYQNQKDPAATPETPSSDPAYANTQNEVWLDFTTDSAGNASAATMVEWEFRPGEAQSIVIHDHRTSTEPGKAGMAGDRLACVPVQFP
ncbi:superoxide dismutase family protein [Tomitella biformata]|uniref:superoxide dismutase family protein n=1 Tax=Tomitella biformata TaxID=630403 RepID=UPI0004646185|nr:superoxide dismutase family protein [Tomitella biformata]